MSEEYEVERILSREEAVATMQAVVDGVASGTLRFESDDESIDVDVPDTLEVEVELELAEDGEGAEVELELEWPVEEFDAEGSDEQADDTPTGGAMAADESETVDAIETAPLGPAAPRESLARFEVYRDRADEWRWRLVHRNGNVIADSGEGYSRKQSALNGMRSVMQNAPGATVEDEFEG